MIQLGLIDHCAVIINLLFRGSECYTSTTALSKQGSHIENLFIGGRLVASEGAYDTLAKRQVIATGQETGAQQIHSTVLDN